MKAIQLIITFLFVLNLQAKEVSEDDCEKIKNEDLTISTSFLTNLDDVILESVKEFSKNLANQDKYELQLAYVQKDMCFATHVAEGCELHGGELKVTIPFDKIYVFAEAGYFESINGKNEEGDPNLISIPIGIGVGMEYVHSEVLRSIYEISYDTHADSEDYWSGGNSNWNEGFKGRVAIEYDMDDSFTVGGGLIWVGSQNSSHYQHHATKSKKPKMSYVDFEGFGEKKISKDTVLGVRGSFMIVKPDSDKTSASNTDPYQQKYPGVNVSVYFKTSF